MDVESPERDEVPDERVEPLSRFTVEVRPEASVVLTVVRVVPLLFTRLSTVVLGMRLVVGVEAVPLALLPPVLVVVVVVLLVEELVEVRADVVVVDVLVSVLVSTFAAVFATSERNWPALRADTPPVGVAVRVTRCSNDSDGCCVA